MWFEQSVLTAMYLLKYHLEGFKFKTFSGRGPQPVHYDMMLQTQPQTRGDR